MVVMVDGAQGAVHFLRMFSNWILISMLSLVTNCMPDGYRRAVWQIRTAGSDVTRLGGGKMIHEVSFDGFTTQSRRGNWKPERQMSLVS